VSDFPTHPEDAVSDMTIENEPAANAGSKRYHGHRIDIGFASSTKFPFRYGCGVRIRLEKHITRYSNGRSGFQRQLAKVSSYFESTVLPQLGFENERDFVARGPIGGGAGWWEPLP
jgi:hypothetical protein